MIKACKEHLRRTLVTVLAFLVVSTGFSDAGIAGPDASVVRVDSGWLKGRISERTAIFEGVPYALPPVGALRWKMPRAPRPWGGVRDATEPSAVCPQPTYANTVIGTEDCLYLNVTTALDGARKKPVMVWIHGGGYRTGSGAESDARQLARQGVVVVTFNYRLGALGFLASRAAGLAGNFGLADQQAALQWVRRNISSFGGNPAAVTVAGQSAGAIAVCSQLASPLAAGLFRAAIMGSGYCQARGLDDAYATGDDFSHSVDCSGKPDEAGCLRTMPAQTLAGATFAAQATVDGPLQPIDPRVAVRNGAAWPVPVMIGLTRDEATIFVYADYDAKGKRVDEASYRSDIRAFYGQANADAVVAHYPISAYAFPALALSAAYTASEVACPDQGIAADLSRNVATYTYRFDDRDAPPNPLMPVPSSFPLGAYHASELTYLFPNPASAPLTRPQRALSRQMVSYWTTFVKSGRPVAAGQPPMPRYSAATHQFLSLKPGGNHLFGDFATQYQCRFWDQLSR